MSSNIPEILREMDEAIRDLWAKGVEELRPINMTDFLNTTGVFHRLTEMRDGVRCCLTILDELRHEVLPLVRDLEQEKENGL